jgi:hypothetical protein
LVTYIATTEPLLQSIKLSGIISDFGFFGALEPLARSHSIHTIDISDNRIFKDKWSDIISSFASLKPNIHTFIMRSVKLGFDLPKVVEQLIKLPNLKKLDLKKNDQYNGFFRYGTKIDSKYEEAVEAARKILNDFNQESMHQNDSLLYGTWGLHVGEYLPKDITQLILGYQSRSIEYELD